MPNIPIWQLASRARSVFYKLGNPDISQAKGPEVLNNEALQSVNAAGTGLVDLIKADASNNVLVGGVASGVFQLNFVLAGTAAAVAANYTLFNTLQDAAKILSVNERHAVAGSSGSPVTAMVKKVPSGTALAAGTDCLAAGLDLKAAALTNQAGVLNATPANYTFAVGDSIGIALTGTPTAVDSVVITVRFQRI